MIKPDQRIKGRAQRFKGRPCAVCVHVRRIEIELALAKDVSQKHVAEAHGLSKDVVHRHWHQHVDGERRARLLVGPVQKAYLSARLAEESGSVLDNLLVTRSALYERLDAALKVGDDGTIGRLTGRLHENFRLTADITGEIQKSPLIANTLNVYSQPHVQGFMQELSRVLRPHPDALRDVVRWLEEQALSAAGAAPLPQRPALVHVSA